MSSENSESIMDEEINKDDAPTLRVKQIKEINLEFDDASFPSTSNNKRKLPDWLQSIESSDVTDGTKKVKIELPLIETQNSEDGLKDNDKKQELPIEEAEKSESDNNNYIVKRSSPIQNDSDIRQELAIEETEKSESVNNNYIVNRSSPIPNCSSSDTNQNEEKVTELKIKVEVKDENEADSSCSSEVKSDESTPAIKTEATSTTRDSCKYGIRCYRRNPIHRLEEAHPGDTDYRRPNFPSPPKGTPDCPFGDKCYRRNPSHFQAFSHPPATDFNKNWKIRQMVLRKRKRTNYAENDSGEDDYDLSDPFIDDNSEDEYEIEDDEDYDSDQ